LLRKLDEMSAEANAQKERYLRTVADLENYRKRAVREKEEVRKQAISSLMEDLLPVLDNFQLGLKSAEMHDGGSAFAEGFRMVLRQMESALTNNGLVPVDPQGETFDPNYHECVAHLPHATLAEGLVIEVQRVGYRYQERLLRPAAVVVSSGPEQNQDEQNAESGEAGGEEQ
jgi:molecular chaperone GrpE